MENNYNAICSLCNKFGFKPYLGVLTGWDWAIKMQDVIPVYEMDLNNGKSRQHFTCKNVKTANEVIKLYTK